MNIDKQSEFSYNQDLSQAAGSYASTNVIDTGVAGSNIGHGVPTVEFYAAVKELFVGSGATVTIKLQTCDAEGFGSNVVDLYTTKAMSISEVNALAAKPLTQRIPSGALRYLRLQYVIGSQTTTAGTIRAGLILNSENRIAFPTSIGDPL